MRKIVKDCKKIEELEHQFISIDCISWEDVDIQYPDNYLIKEAKHRIDICNEWIADLYEDDYDYPYYVKSKNQLNKFINKWSSKCESHVNDNLSYEEIKEKIIEENEFK